MSEMPPSRSSSYTQAENAHDKTLDHLTLEKFINREVTADELQIQATTLRTQAEIARQAGFDRVAENLIRAAELTQVPNDALLQMYEALRPGRSNYQQLISLAGELESRYRAQETGRFIREAAEIYRLRGLLT